MKRKLRTTSSRVSVNKAAWEEGWLNSGLDLGPLAEKFGLSRDQLRRIVHGGGTTWGIVKKAAKLFKVAPEELLGDDAGKKRHSGWAMNFLKGLRQGGVPLHGPDKAAYQTFVVEEENRACIAYHWTEMCGDWLRVESAPCSKQDLGNVLQVTYSHSGTMSSPNVAIHPQRQIPRKRLPGQDYVCLQARYVRYSPFGEEKGNPPPEPSIGIRIADAFHYQWAYEPRDERPPYFRLSSEFS
nr:hypothetical protein [Pirellulales bacterium]